MKKLIVLFNALLLTTTMFAESASNVRVQQNGNEIVVTYDLLRRAKVKLLMATGSSTNFRELQAVTGDIGNDVPKGNNKTITWHPLAESTDFIADNVRFRVEAAGKYDNYMDPDKHKVKTTLMFQMAYSSTPQLSYGGFFGQMYGHGIGWYLDILSNFKDLSVWPSDFHYTCGQGGVINDHGSVGVPLYTGKVENHKVSCHVGYMMDILGVARAVDNRFNTFGFYCGLGYGFRLVAWEFYGTYENKWAKYEPTSFSSVACNVGLFGSAYGFTMKAGMNTIQFKYFEFEAGIGYMF